jgi:hypothetical protein
VVSDFPKQKVDALIMKRDKSMEVINTDLEIEEHLREQSNGFVIQKIGLCLILTIVSLAAIGLFGDGLISHAEINSSSGTARYERFHRHEAAMKLGFQVPSVTGKCTVSLPTAYLDKVEVESLTPSPQSTTVSNNLVHYTFSGAGDMNIVFHLIPRKVGRIEGDIQVDDGHFQISHFIFP